MIRIKDSQLTELSLNAERLFLYRIENLIKDLYPELAIKLTELGGNKFLRSCLDKAKTLHIDIEQDVFDFSLLNIEHGLDFYKEQKNEFDLDWLASEYVPGQSKVTMLKEKMIVDEK